MRKIASVIALVLLATATPPRIGLAQSGMATNTIRHGAAHDQETQVGSFVWTWHSNGGCSANQLPELSTMTPPSNGAVRFAPGNVKSSDCLYELPGLLVMYRPNPGFVGHDQFVVLRKAIQGPLMAGTASKDLAVTYDITVH